MCFMNKSVCDELLHPGKIGGSIKCWPRAAIVFKSIITVQISHNAAAAYHSATTAIQYIEILPRMEGDQYL